MKYIIDIEKQTTQFKTFEVEATSPTMARIKAIGEAEIYSWKEDTKTNFFVRASETVDK